MKDETNTNKYIGPSDSTRIEVLESEQNPANTSTMSSSSVHPASLSAVESKIETGRSKKNAADAAFKDGDIKGGESTVLD